MQLQVSWLVLVSQSCVTLQAALCVSLLQSRASLDQGAQVSEEAEPENRVDKAATINGSSLTSIEASLLSLADQHQTEAVSEEIRAAVELILESAQQIRKDLQAQHHEDQNEINSSLALLSQCNDDLRTANTTYEDPTTGHVIVGLSDLRSAVDSSRGVHSSCRKSQENASDAETSKCGEYDAQRKGRFASPPNCDLEVFRRANTDDPQQLKEFKLCVTQMSDWVCDLNSYQSDCSEATKSHEDTHQLCDERQEDFEIHYCRWSERFVEVCVAHSQRCAGMAEHHEGRVQDVMISERVRKLDHQSVELIDCVAKFLLLDSGKTSDMLTACKNATVDSSILDIDYGQVPTLLPCAPPELEPCQGAWLEQEYMREAWYQKAPTATCKPCKDESLILGSKTSWRITVDAVHDGGSSVQLTEVGLLDANQALVPAVPTRHTQGGSCAQACWNCKGGRSGSTGAALEIDCMNDGNPTCADQTNVNIGGYYQYDHVLDSQTPHYIRLARCDSSLERWPSRVTISKRTGENLFVECATLDVPREVAGETFWLGALADCHVRKASWRITVGAVHGGSSVQLTEAGLLDANQAALPYIPTRHIQGGSCAHACWNCKGGLTGSTEADLAIDCMNDGNPTCEDQTNFNIGGYYQYDDVLETSAARYISLARCDEDSGRWPSRVTISKSTGAGVFTACATLDVPTDVGPQALWLGGLGKCRDLRVGDCSVFKEGAQYADHNADHGKGTVTKDYGDGRVRVDFEDGAKGTYARDELELCPEG